MVTKYSSPVLSFMPPADPISRCQPVMIPFAWVQRSDGEWEWEEDDPNYIETIAVASTIDTSSTATPQLPAGKLKPKQSLGQNFLKDPNTVAKIIRAFHADVTRDGKPLESIIELGPGAGALTDRLMENYGSDILQCIEIDPRSVEILNARYPDLTVYHEDVLQVNYPELAKHEGHPLVVIGNLPYYITSQILFALADASHFGAVQSATVTMQWEVAQRMVAPTRCKVSLTMLLSLKGCLILYSYEGSMNASVLLSFLAGLWDSFGCLPNVCRSKKPLQNPTDGLLSSTESRQCFGRTSFSWAYKAATAIGRCGSYGFSQGRHDSLSTKAENDTKFIKEIGWNRNRKAERYAVATS